MTLRLRMRNVISLTALFAALIGVAQTFLIVFPLAIFLSTYRGSSLTYVYMSMGVIIFLIGNFFRYVQRNLSFIHLLSSTLIVFAISLIFFWGLLVETHFKWIPMALLIWATVTYTFVSLVLSNLLVCIFTLQEGKKLFGIIGGWRALGGTIGGFLTPLLVRTIGSNTALLLAPAVLFIALGALFLLYRTNQNRFEEKKLTQDEKKISFKTLKNKSYVLCIFALATVSLFNYYSIDLLFNTEVKRHFSTEAEIAGFLGIFTAISNIFAVLGGFFLFSILLDKLGLIFTLFLTPVIIGGLMALTLLTDLIPPAASLVFGVYCFTVLMERMLRQSINSESLNLLYSPLRPAESQWAQLQYRINIQSLSTSFIGVILFGIHLAVGTSIPSIALFVIAISISGVMVMLMVKRDFVKILVGALEKWALYKPELTQMDKDTLTVLKGRLKSPYPEEVIFVLESIEKNEPNASPAILVEALDNPSAEVRLYALKKIERQKVTEAQKKVEQICGQEKDPNVRGQAIRALGAISTIERNFLSDTDPQIAANSIIAMILYGSDSIKHEAILQLSKQPKLIVAQVLKEVDIPDKADRLLPLLTDPDIEVRLAACRAARNLRDERLYPSLIENLTHAHLHYAASKTLLKAHPVGYIRTNFDRFSRQAQEELLYLLGKIPGEETILFLQTNLASPDRALFKASLHSLGKLSYKAANRTQISALLAAENQNICFLKPVIESLSEAPVLHDLLIREVELIQESIFLLLTFIYPTQPIRSAKDWAGITRSK